MAVERSDVELNAYKKKKMLQHDDAIVKGQSFELLRDELKAFGYSWNKIYKKENEFMVETLLLP